MIRDLVASLTFASVVQDERALKEEKWWGSILEKILDVERGF